MSSAPQTRGPSRAAQIFGLVFVVFLVASTVFEATAQTRWLAQFGVVLKYLGLAVVVAWPLLHGEAGRQTFGNRVMIGLSLMLLGTTLHWGVHFKFF